MPRKKVDRTTGEIIDEKKQGELFIVDSSGDIEAEVPLNNIIEIQTATIKIPPITQDAELLSLSEEAIKINMYAERMFVVDVPSAKQATNDLTMIAGYIKEITGKQKEWEAEPKKHLQEIKDAFALLLKPLQAADKTLRAKVLTFNQEQERRRKEEEAAAELQRLANEAKMKLAEQNDDQFVEIEDVPEVVTEAPQKTYRADVGNASVQHRWKARIKEGLTQQEILEKLPLMYHQINMTLINQVVRGKEKNGITEADFGGVIEIYDEAGLMIRGKS